MEPFRRLLVLAALGIAGCRCPSPDAPPTTAIQSTITIRCGSSQYTLTTGKEGGKCQTTVNGAGNTTGGTCLDGNGNSAHATCEGNSGNGRCVTSAGAGECRQTALTMPTDPAEPPPGDVQPVQ